MDDRLLEILCCPVSRRPLERAGSALLEKLREVQSQDGLQYVDGTPVGATVDAALITDDGRVAYLIEDDIPVLLPERGIGTEQLERG